MDHATLGRPLSIKDISEEAKNYQWNPSIPFKYWARAADAIYREVRDTIQSLLLAGPS
jgi:hypothetical protein